jgi:MtN3 and saliva related transmembrane protein
MDLLIYTGYIAGICSTVAFIPQVRKTWNSGSAKDISWGLLALLFTGVSLWVVYGVINQDIPIIAANTITGMLVASLLFMKFWFDYRYRGL